LSPPVIDLTVDLDALRNAATSLTRQYGLWDRDYGVYRQKARDVAAIFADATGLAVADASLEPLVT
jgi:hypothetical protein